MSIRKLTLFLGGLVIGLAAAAAPPNFTGTWVLNHQKSKNLGMMSAMNDTVTVSQTAAELTVDDNAAFNGSAMHRVTRYNLAGDAVKNDSPTGDPAETTSHWQGQELVTVWVTQGSIAGSTHRRIERRYLSPDGQTMFEVSGAAANDPKALVLAFDRK